MSIYQQDASGSLSGPVELPPVPGGGVLVPFGFVRIEQVLNAPEPGKTWSVVGDTVEQVEDHRGLVYVTLTGSPIEWRELGPLPDSVTSLPRPSIFHHWADGQWVLNPDAVYAAKVVEINRACETAISGGFVSLALGGEFVYGSGLEDQLNLTGAVLRGEDMPYPCRDDQGVKAHRLHTIEQLKQVNADFTLFKLQLLQHADNLKQLLDQALAAGDADTLVQVTWEAAQS